MSKVIFLNGCAAAGKTTLAKEIQNLSKEKFLYVGIDALFGAIPKKIVGFDKQAEEGFRYVVDPKTGVLTEMKASSYAIQVFSCLPKVVKLLADNGLNVIFDECNFVKKSDTEFLIDDYKTLFSSHQFYIIGVKVKDLETLEQREEKSKKESRKDRVLGMAKIFYHSEESFNYPYDLIVDNAVKSPSANAKKILKFVESNKSQSFAKK